MTAFRLSYLFYAGIVLPTVVTLALFVFFVICWRKQSARKAVLTKPYDPHGTMRRLGIPNKPPPPPLFLHYRSSGGGGGSCGGLLTPTSEELGGEDNAAYDMSRSPSAEASGGRGNSAAAGGGGVLESRAVFQDSPPCALAELELERSVVRHQLHVRESPSGEFELTGRLAFHHHLLPDGDPSSEPACDSPGGRGCGGGVGVSGGGGGVVGVASGVGVASRDWPQSQASHSPHSTDSEDSGFRSARSGQLCHQGHHAEPHAVQQQQLRRSRSSGGRGKGRGYYHRAATSSPDSDTEPPLPLTPTTLWFHQHHRPRDLCQRVPSAEEEEEDDNAAKSSESEHDDDDDEEIHRGWKYLQDWTLSPERKARDRASRPSGCGGGSGHGKGAAGVCSGSGSGTGSCSQNNMTLAQVHSSGQVDHHQPEVLGFSVV